MVVAALLLGAVLGTSLGYVRWHGRQPGYVRSRAIVLEAEAIAVPNGRSLALGDSTVERVYTADLCGGMFNGAVSYATTRDLLAIAPKLIAEANPRLIVLGAGYNDFETGSSLDDFRARELKLVALAGQRPLVLIGIPEHPDASQIVQEIAAQHHAAYVQPIEGALTVDGRHPNAQGEQEWRRRVASVCR